MDDPADEIRRVMEDECLSFRDVDSKGYSMASLSRILRGAVSPTWKTIQAIASVLGYTAYVVFEKNERHDG